MTDEITKERRMSAYASGQDGVEVVSHASPRPHTAQADYDARVRAALIKETDT